MGHCVWIFLLSRICFLLKQKKPNNFHESPLVFVNLFCSFFLFRLSFVFTVIFRFPPFLFSFLFFFPTNKQRKSSTIDTFLKQLQQRTLLILFLLWKVKSKHFSPRLFRKSFATIFWIVLLLSIFLFVFVFFFFRFWKSSWSQQGTKVVKDVCCWNYLCSETNNKAQIETVTRPKQTNELLLRSKYNHPGTDFNVVRFKWNRHFLLHIFFCLCTEQNWDEKIQDWKRFYFLETQKVLKTKDKKKKKTSLFWISSLRTSSMLFVEVALNSGGLQV